MKTHTYIRQLMLAALATVFNSAASTTAYADDHGNTTATATAVTLPSSVPGNLEAAGDSDFFKVVLPQAAKLRVFSTGNTWVYGSLYVGNAHSSAFRNVANTNFNYTQDLPAGTYYFRAYSLPVTTNGSTVYPTGPYTLNFSTSAISATQPRLNISYGGVPITPSTVIDYGTIPVGSTAQRPLVITNTGKAALKMHFASMGLSAVPVLPPGTPFPYLLSPVINNTTIAPGGMATFNLVFKPTHAATQNLAMQISSTDMNALFATIKVTAAASTGAISPDIAAQNGPTNLANNSSITFGNIARSPHATYRELTLLNTSETPLTISSCIVQPTTVGGTSGFNFATPPPTSIAGNTQATLRFAVNVATTGARSAKLIVTSNDPDESPFTLTLNANVIVGTPDLAVSIDGRSIANNGNYHFGSTFLSLPLARTLTLSNNGTGTTSISSWSSRGGFRFVGPFSGSLHLAPGMSITTTVQFLPLISLGYNTGFLELISNAASKSTYRINTAGIATESTTPGDIAVTDATVGSGGVSLPKLSNVGFGSISVGSTSSKTVRVTNNGSGPLYLGTISIFQSLPTATASTAPIMRLAASPAIGTALAPGASADYVIDFKPVVPGISYKYLFTIYNSDSTDRAYTLALTGNSQL